MRTVGRACRGIVAMLGSGEKAESGNAIVEYALVLTFLSITAITGLTVIGQAATQALLTFETSLGNYNIRHG